MNEVDYLYEWGGHGEDFNMGSFFTLCKNNNKTPVVIAYLIAFTSRRDWGLQDCNVSETNNLCQRGADYIRQNKDRLLSQYTKYARGAAEAFGTEEPVVWFMEPDYYQYGSDQSQEGGPLTFQECGDFMEEIVQAIKAACPNSVFSMDLSPWHDTTSQKNWYGSFTMSSFSFINGSGGTSKAHQEYPNDTWSTALPTYAWLYKTFGKPFFADAGGSHDSRWDDISNLNARIDDGVFGVAHQNAPSDWGSTVSALRPQLNLPPNCNEVTENFKVFQHETDSPLTVIARERGRLEVIDMRGRTVYSHEVFPCGDILNNIAVTTGYPAPGMYIFRTTGSLPGAMKKNLIPLY
jgi:hypothetical protein